MIFSPLHILGFGVISVLLIALLVAVPGPFDLITSVDDPRSEAPEGPPGPHPTPVITETTPIVDAELAATGPARINRHTGERILGPRERLNRVRALGDARLALERVRSLADADPDEPLYDRPLLLLNRELSVPLAPADADPVIGRLLEGEMATDELVDLLEHLWQDRQIAAATEGFFGGADRYENFGAGTARPPDAKADEMARGLALGRTDLHRYVDLAESFGHHGRGRAQVRWLLRGLRRYPGSSRLYEALIDAYIAESRTAEAWAVCNHALPFSPSSLAFWQRRAELSSWLTRPADEANALERTLTMGEDPPARERLLQLYAFLGTPARAVPHAMELARSAGEVVESERAIHLALTSGVPDRALDLLEQLIDDSANPRRWRELAIRYALQDLQVDRAIRLLEHAVADEPTVAYLDQLEGLYRGAERWQELADLLDRRLSADPQNRGRWLEALTLSKSLGDEPRTNSILARMAAFEEDAGEFFAHFQQFQRGAVPRLEQRALEVAQAADMPATAVAEVLERLRPYFGRPGVRRIAEALLDRHPDDPDAPAFRLELVDALPTPFDRANAAGKLAQHYPDNATLLRAWIDRSAWADLSDQETRGRELWSAKHPNDLDNRGRLAELYESGGKLGDAIEIWRELAEAAGVRSAATTRLIAALLGADRLDEAMNWVRRRAEHPDSSNEDRIDAAEQLFGLGRTDQAAVLFRAVVERDADHPLALLRLGQIHSWSNDPGGAIRFLERRLAASADDRELIDYYLGEAYWSVRQPERATELHRRAVDVMGAREARTSAEDSMIARMLFRLGRTNEAIPLYRTLLIGEPQNSDLALDLAEVLLHGGDLAEARDWIDHAARRDAFGQRLLRVDGQLRLRAGDVAAARASFERSLRDHGPDAGVFADLGHTLELQGEWVEALGAYRRWLALQNESSQAQRAVHRLEDQVAIAGVGAVRFRATGDDRTIESEVGAAVPLDDALRANVRLSHGRYEGRAAALTAAGLREATTDLFRVDAALVAGGRTGNAVGGGVTLLAEAPGDALSGWLGVRLQQSEPFTTLELRGYAGEPWTNPTAALGLAGRRHGLHGSAYQDLGERWWAGIDARIEALEARAPGAGRTTETAVQGQLLIGRRFTSGDIAVTDRFRPDRVSAGPLSPRLETVAEGVPPWLLDTWVGAEATYMFEGDLAQLLPVGRRFRYLVAGARLDRRIASCLGASLNAHFAYEVDGADGAWGIDGLATWRPSHPCEITAGASVGRALARADDGDSFGLQLQLVLRW
ncbi:MAG: tetratricopeptide repeat protein [Planctomycetota bacterium]